uniref:Uncharacterized protein n=1 Tax=Amphimedon queenslandica TaxID=400682 RepID=A0A1X7V417_AMPQE
MFIKKIRETVSIMTSFSFSCHLAMRMNYFMMVKLSKKHLIATLLTMKCLEANEKFRKLLKCRDTLKFIQDTRAASREDECNVEDNGPQLMGRIKDSINDMRDMNAGSHLTLQERQSMLITDQRRIFAHIKNSCIEAN